MYQLAICISLEKINENKCFPELLNLLKYTDNKPLYSGVTVCVSPGACSLRELNEHIPYQRMKDIVLLCL